jgi:uncharacterized protein (TIGR03437 family)
MKKARFTLLAALFLLPCVSMGQYMGFWADAFHDGYKTPQQVDQLIADARRAGANVLFVEARVRANSLYVKSLEPPFRDPGYSPDFDALAEVISKAHAAGIEAHAWLVICPAGSDAEMKADPRHILNTHGPSAAGRDNWIALDNTGKAFDGSNYSLDPGHPDAAAYIADVVEHLVQNYAVDGIHFDYVRYAGNTWGYNPVSVERFNRLNLKTGTAAPADAAWSEFRRQQVTALVRQMYLRAVKFRREIKVSAALIAWGDAPATAADWTKSSAYSGVMQDWVAWLKEGILDLGIPMNYDREHDASQKRWFDNWLRFERENQGRRMILPGPAIYLNSTENSLAQAQRVLASPQGAKPFGGVVFYSYACTNWSQCGTGGSPPLANNEFYARAGDFFAALGPAATPVLPWKVGNPNGHVLGEIRVDGQARSPLADGISTVLTAGQARQTATVDGTGSFGFVEVAPGSYTLTGYRGVTVVLPATDVIVRAGEVSAVSLQLTASVAAAATPAPSQSGVTNAANYSGAVLTPGSLLSIYGSGLADTTAKADKLPLPADLAGTQVLINGAIAPLLYVSPLQINAQAPFGLEGAEATVVVRRWGLESATVRVPIAEAGPGLFAPVAKLDYSLVSPANPLARGGIAVLWGTGLGEVTPRVAAGAAAPAAGAATVARAEVTVGGRPARVLYCGLAPGFAGLYQINIEIPADAPLGDMLPVQVIVAGRGSNNAFVSIR